MKMGRPKKKISGYNFELIGKSNKTDNLIYNGQMNIDSKRKRRCSMNRSFNFRKNMDMISCSFCKSPHDLNGLPQKNDNICHVGTTMENAVQNKVQSVLVTETDFSCSLNSNCMEDGTIAITCSKDLTRKKVEIRGDDHMENAGRNTRIKANEMTARMILVPTTKQHQKGKNKVISTLQATGKNNIKKKDFGLPSETTKQIKVNKDIKIQRNITSTSKMTKRKMPKLLQISSKRSNTLKNKVKLKKIQRQHFDIQNKKLVMTSISDDAKKSVKKHSHTKDQKHGNNMIFTTQYTRNKIRNIKKIMIRKNKINMRGNKINYKIHHLKELTVKLVKLEDMPLSDILHNLRNSQCIKACKEMNIINTKITGTRKCNIEKIEKQNTTIPHLYQASKEQDKFKDNKFINKICKYSSSSETKSTLVSDNTITEKRRVVHINNKIKFDVTKTINLHTGKSKRLLKNTSSCSNKSNDSVNKKSLTKNKYKHIFARNIFYKEKLRSHSKVCEEQKQSEKSQTGNESLPNVKIVKNCESATHNLNILKTRMHDQIDQENLFLLDHITENAKQVNCLNDLSTLSSGHLQFEVNNQKVTKRNPGLLMKHRHERKRKKWATKSINSSKCRKEIHMQNILCCKNSTKLGQNKKHITDITVIGAHVKLQRKKYARKKKHKENTVENGKTDDCTAIEIHSTLLPNDKTNWPKTMKKKSRKKATKDISVDLNNQGCIKKTKNTIHNGQMDKKIKTDQSSSNQKSRRRRKNELVQTTSSRMSRSSKAASHTWNNIGSNQTSETTTDQLTNNSIQTPKLKTNITDLNHIKCSVNEVHNASSICTRKQDNNKIKKDVTTKWIHRAPSKQKGNTIIVGTRKHYKKCAKQKSIIDSNDNSFARTNDKEVQMQEINKTYNTLMTTDKSADISIGNLNFFTATEQLLCPNDSNYDENPILNLMISELERESSGTGQLFAEDKSVFEKKNRQLMESNTSSNDGEEQEEDDNATSNLTDLYNNVDIFNHLEKSSLPEKLFMTEQRKWHCDLCDEKFALIRNFLRHKYFTHNDETAVHVCDNCAKVLTSVAMVNIHVCTNVRTWFCTRCNLEFHSSVALTGHNMQMHLESVGPHKCDQCSLTFLTNYMLAKHRAKRHANINNAIFSNKTRQTTTNSSNTANDTGDIDVMSRSLTNNRNDVRMIKCIRKLDLNTIFNSDTNLLPRVLQETSNYTVTCTLIRGKDQYTCNICNEICFSTSEIKQHLGNQHNINIDSCEFCGDLYLPAKLISHLIDQHIVFDNSRLKQDRVVDSSIVNTTSASNVYTYHDLTRILGPNRITILKQYQVFCDKIDGDYIHCVVCSEEYLNVEGYMFHVAQWHDTICVFCNMEFESSIEAVQHKRDMHRSISSYLWGVKNLLTELFMQKNHYQIMNDIIYRFNQVSFV